MGQKSSDVVHGGLRELGISLGIVEQIFSFLPQGLVDVHPGAVVAEERLGHEGAGLSVRMGNVLQDVLVHHDLVSHGGQGAESHTDLALSGGGDLVVVISHSMPVSMSLRTISDLRSCSESVGGTGKYPSLFLGR